MKVVSTVSQLLSAGGLGELIDALRVLLMGVDVDDGSNDCEPRFSEGVSGVDGVDDALPLPLEVDCKGESAVDSVG